MSRSEYIFFKQDLILSLENIFLLEEMRFKRIILILPMTKTLFSYFLIFLYDRFENWTFWLFACQPFDSFHFLFYNTHLASILIVQFLPLPKMLNFPAMYLSPTYWPSNVRTSSKKMNCTLFGWRRVSDQKISDHVFVSLLAFAFHEYNDMEITTQLCKIEFM